jgi:hypothetical protein
MGSHHFCDGVFGLDMSANGAELILPRSSGPPGSSLPLPITFNSGVGSVTGIRFDLRYESSTLNLTAITGRAARTAGKALYVWQVYPGLSRFFIIGLNLKSEVER